MPQNTFINIVIRIFTVDNEAIDINQLFIYADIGGTDNLKSASTAGLVSSSQMACLLSKQV